MRLADGREFRFWDDETEYARVYHVAQRRPGASDENPGTEAQPFASIGRAAALLQPGEKVVVHEGVYRECVRPARGGADAKHMIAYEAAPGELVRIAGSEVWAPEFRPSRGWRRLEQPGMTIWSADLPAEWFTGYNPFTIRNASDELWTFTQAWTREEMERFLLTRGWVFLEGRPLRQVFRPSELAQRDGAFWVEPGGLRLHLRLWEDADPQGKQFEVTAREQVFAPGEFHLGYVRVSGFHLEQAADGVPIPQRALLSTTRGHHWIIEDNVIRWANAVGMDVGGQSWHAELYEPAGYHVLRRNQVSQCGVCGIAGAYLASHSLVEDNLIQHIGGMGIERLYESAGLKFHVCTGALFRRNVFRHIRDAAGMWLDVSNRNCRITNNVFADIVGRLGAMYLECSQAKNLIDNNVFWNVRNHEGAGPALGVRLDSCENTVVAHNLFGRIGDQAISANLIQAGRLIDGRVGLSRRQRFLNNVFVHCPKRISLARREDNVSDGNLFDAAGDAASFLLPYPAPETVLNLEGWQEYFGLDPHSTQVAMTGEFDPDTGRLDWSVDGTAPVCQPVEELELPEGPRPPGPFRLEEWKGNGEEWSVVFPRGE